MKITISPNGNRIFESHKLQIDGRKAAGVYAFTFTIIGLRKPCKTPTSIFDINLSVALAGSSMPLVGPISSITQLVQCYEYANNSEQLHFEITLTKEQINFVEEYRQEGDIKLSLALRALVSSPDGLLPSYDIADFVVPRQEWLKALKDAGFRQTVLFEIPLPACADEAEELITKAQEFIEVGHYKDAVMQCRHIIEHIQDLRGDKKVSAEANKMAHGNNSERQSMSAEQRLLSIREQLKNVCQLGAHGAEQFTRSQARAVLGMTMVLLAEPTVGYSKFLSEAKSRTDVDPEVKEQHQEQAASQPEDPALAESTPN
ncbi:hypothetical protein ABGI61_08455 [Rheinheimera sp. FR7-31]|uniref:hypothetical protein n=1 Tax=Rheinheimera fenheensis TaxID=3152295 RepID=UPI00325EC98E